MLRILISYFFWRNFVRAGFCRNGISAAGLCMDTVRERVDPVASESVLRMNGTNDDDDDGGVHISEWYNNTRAPVRCNSPIRSF